MKSNITRKPAPTRKTLRMKTSGDSRQINFQNTFQRKNESKSSLCISRWRRLFFINLLILEIRIFCSRHLPAADFFLDSELIFLLGPVLLRFSRACLISRAKNRHSARRFGRTGAVCQIILWNPMRGICRARRDVARRRASENARKICFRFEEWRIFSPLANFCTSIKRSR